MISSEDVRRVTFDKAMRGYRCDDVDDYLKQVAESMDASSFWPSVSTSTVPRKTLCAPR